MSLSLCVCLSVSLSLSLSHSVSLSPSLSLSMSVSLSLSLCLSLRGFSAKKIKNIQIKHEPSCERQQRAARHLSCRKCTRTRRNKRTIKTTEEKLAPVQAKCVRSTALKKMAAPIDLELKKAFSELQVKMIDTQQKVKLADLQIDQLTRVQKHAKLTHAEITTLPDNTRLYEGVGRMFILQSKEDINNQLSDKQRTADEKIKELEKKVYLERSVKEAEDNIREMLLSRRAH
ncbi:hypothetical protein PAMA_005600 [Pampus argenteus]